MSTEHKLNQERREELKLLYPWYKEEVFRRREQMAWLTGFASGVLVLVLVLLLIVPAAVSPDGIVKVFAGSGVVVFSGIVAYLVLQQRARHLLAKQVLVTIERELGLYEEGRFFEGAALYPTDWQTAWTRDSSVTIYLSILAALTGLVLAAVLLR